jgi:hypothetical protein
MTEKKAMDSAEIDFFPYISITPDDYRWCAQTNEAVLTFILSRDFVAEALHAKPVLGNARLILDYGDVIRPACEHALAAGHLVKTGTQIEVTLLPQDI